MRIGFFCYNLSGTGPRTRAKDIINGLSERSDHDIYVLTHEPDRVSNEATVKQISLSNPIHLIWSSRMVFDDCHIVQVPINIWQVAFVRMLYSGPLVAGVGPGIQPETYSRKLAKLLDVDVKIDNREGSAWAKDGFETSICTATINQEVFSPCVDEKSTMIRNEFGLDEQSDIVLYIGDLSEQYGAKIISEMARRDDQLTYLVIGDGDLQDKFQNRSDLEYIGYVSNEELPKYYNIADITVGPRKMDVTSNVGLESISCGTPFITTAEGPIQEFAVEPGAYVYSERNAEAVLETINELLNDEELYNKQVQRGLEFIENNPLTLDSAIETHLEVYEELTS